MNEKVIDLEQDPSPEFVKGFNEGYLLSEYFPDLADKLTKAFGDSERSKGFVGGNRQYNRDHDLEILPDWMQDRSDKKQEYDMDKDHEIDRGDIEPEI